MRFYALHNIILLPTFEEMVNLAVLLEIIHSQFGQSASGSHTLHAKTCIASGNDEHSIV